MRPLWVAIDPKSDETRVLATAGTNGSGDDPIGSSPPMPAAQLDNLNTAFGNVLTLSMRRG